VKILFDQNISFRLVNRIKDIFPLAKQVRDVGIENYSDRDIWLFAQKENYIIVTFDSDFYDFSVVWGLPPKIILIKSFDQTSNNIEALLRKHLNNIQAFSEDKELACLEIIDKR
jgi:predicted nuclease of predicted toxin-antitoxin system